MPEMQAKKIAQNLIKSKDAVEIQLVRGVCVLVKPGFLCHFLLHALEQSVLFLLICIKIIIH